MIDYSLLIDIELSAANLYARLSARAKKEGLLDLSVDLARMASQERSQAQKLDPLMKTGKLKGQNQWSHYWHRGQPARQSAALGSRESRVRRYLGSNPLDQPWTEILPKLGSAELLISLYYLFVLKDFRTFKEELGHARYNGVKINYLLKGLICLLPGSEGI